MKVQLYFIFYVAMILELLVFIVDRDRARTEAEKLASEITLVAEDLATTYSTPLRLEMADTVHAVLWRPGRAPTRVPVLPVPLWNVEREKEGLTFTLRMTDAGGKTLYPRARTDSLFLWEKDGQGFPVLVVRIPTAGNYRCQLEATVPRVFPDFILGHPKLSDTLNAKFQRHLSAHFTQDPGGGYVVRMKEPKSFIVKVRDSGTPFFPCPFCGGLIEGAFITRHFQEHQ